MRSKSRFGFIGLLFSFLIAPPGALLAAAGAGPVVGPSPATMASKPAGLSAEAWSSIMQQVQRELYAAEPDKAGILQAYNQAQRLNLSFASAGPKVVPGSRANALEFNLLRYGYGPSLVPVSPVAPVAEKNRIEYRHGPVVEWYVNQAGGLEQGFTIAAPPVGGAAGPLRLEIGVKTELMAKAQPDGGLVFADAKGAAHFGFGGFTARDAQGRILPAKMELVPSGPGAGTEVRVALVVDDRSASYPVVLDPTLISLETVISPNYQSVFPASSYLGSSVALSGDGQTLIVGIPDANAGGQTASGAAFIFAPTAGWQLQAEIAGDKLAGYNFGSAVALSYNGKVALVGSDSSSVTSVSGAGNAFVFTLNTSGAWTKQQTLNAGSDVQDSAAFGNSVALSSDGTIGLIGAYQYGQSNNGHGAPPGAAYVFKNVSGTWTQQQKLVDPTSGTGAFGLSVALSGTSSNGEIALIGAPADNSLLGEVFSYISSNSGSTWTEIGGAALPVPSAVTSNSSTPANYGWSVAISSDGATALIGAPNLYDGSNNPEAATGTAYVLTYSAGAWNTPVPLPAPSGLGTLVNGETFGEYVAISGVSGSNQVALVGAPYGDPFVTGHNGISPPGPGAGAAYFYTYSGSAWTNASYVQGNDSTPQNGFGMAVALDNNADTAVVGAPFSSPNSLSNSGSAYVYSYTEGAAWTFPTQEVEITGADENQHQYGGGAGTSVAMAGDNEIIVGFPGAAAKGAPGAGEAFVFTLSGGIWNQAGKLTASDPVAGANFGDSVAAASNGNFVVGARLASPAPSGISVTQAGEAYVFAYNHATGGYAQQGNPLIASDAAGGANFGISVAISADGNTVLVGAPSAASGFGRAYAFAYNNSIWGSASGNYQVQNNEFSASDGTTNSAFGSSVAVSGTSGSGQLAVVGAPYASSSHGEVYLYTSSSASGASWTAAQGPLTPMLVLANSNFGAALAISADASTLVVGAPAYSSSGAELAKVYVYTNSAGIFPQGSEQSQIDPDFSTGVLTGYGGAVAVSQNGQVGLIGSNNWAYTSFNEVGTAHVFTVTSGVFTVQSTDFRPTPTQGYTQIGDSVAVSPDGLYGAVGAPGVTVAGVANAGAAYVLSLSSVSVTSPSSVYAILNQAFSYQGAATGGTGSYTFTETGNLPGGVGLNASTGVISGTPSANGIFTITLTATDTNGHQGQETVTLNVNIVGLTSSLNVTGIEGTGFSYNLSSTGGTGPYSYQVSAGSLPAGLSLNGSTGAITGTPTGTGTSTFTIAVSDSAGNFSTEVLTITVNVVGITSARNVTAVQNYYFSFQLTAAGGASPYTYSLVGGALPNGLSLNTATGQITGTPTTLGASTVTVQLTDHNGLTGQSKLTINVNVMGITSSLNVSGIKNVQFNYQANTSGGDGTYFYSFTGTLPAGLNLNPSTGQITGTPTATGAVSGTLNVVDTSSPTPNVASATLTITINSIGIGNGPNFNGILGVPLSIGLNGNGGTGPYSFALAGASGPLPTGLTLSSGGQITGTPTAGGTSFIVTVTDSTTPTPKTANVPLSITVTTLGFTSNNSINGVAGFPLTYHSVVAGGATPYTYSLTSDSNPLPTGLTLNAATGAITGTPSATGQTFVTLMATDSATPTPNTAQINLDITINTVGITSATNLLGYSGSGFNYQTTVEGGTSPYGYAITSGSLPAGLNLNTSTGAIGGTAGSPGFTSFTLTVTDHNANTASSQFFLTIVTPLNINGNLNPSGSVGEPFSYQASAGGGTGSYVYSLTSGSLPTGLSLNTSNGQVTGTPTVTGSFPITVTVTDSSSHTASLSPTITIYAGLSLTGSPAASGVSGSSFSFQPTTTGGTGPYTYSLTSGSLPAGLSLNPSTGQVTGMPSATGSFPITITVTDSNSSMASDSPTITIGFVGISTPSSASAVDGSAFSFGLFAYGGTSPYTFSLTGGSLPAGLTLNASTGVISGTTTATPGVFNATFTVTDHNSNTGSANLAITVSTVGITNSTQSALNGFVGVPFSYQINAAGGTGPYTFSLANNSSLPPGLSLNTSTGLISGTPTTSPFVASSTINVTDTASHSGQATFNFYIAFIGFTSGTNLNGFTGTSFSYQATVVGGTGPYTYSIASGTLPTGLTLNTSTGLISGTPGATGFSGVTLLVVDMASHQAQTNLAININLGLTLSGAPTASGTAGSFFSYQPTTNGGAGPYAYSLTSGSLPPGVTLNSTNGQVSGTTSATGTLDITITVTDSASNTASVSPAITFNPPAPVISSSLSASGDVGSPFTYQITASNSPTSYSASPLPGGLTVNTSTGAITGTPLASGLTNVTISATNAGGTASVTLAINIGAAGAPIITSSLFATGTSGSGFTYNITASNTPTSYSATGLPAGLSVNTGTGAITGTPSVSGNFNVAISATNGSGTGSATVALTINPSPPAITSSLTATGTNGSPFTYTITGSNSPSGYGATVLPAGLSVNTSTGAITGTPTATGNFNVTLSATNAGGTGLATLALTINPPPPAITSSLTGSGTSGSSFTYGITGSHSPTSYSATGLPTGLSVNTSTGAITGTPTAIGNFNVTIGATNAGGTGTATLVLTVNPPAPAITSSLTAGVTVNGSFSYTITASNSPTSYSATGLPTGLTVNTSTGAISGTPTATGTTNVTISATNAGGTGSATLAITVNPVANGTYFGTIGSGQGISSVSAESHIASGGVGTNIAAEINPAGTGGALIGYISSINAGFAVSFTLSPSDTFSASTISLTGTASTGQTLTFTGSVTAGTISGTIVELSLPFTASIDASSGSSAAVAGFYQAPTITATGGTYTIVGTQGEVFALAVTPSGVSAGVGTASAGGVISVTTQNGATIAGTVTASSDSLVGTITPSGGGVISFSGSVGVPTFTVSPQSQNVATGRSAAFSVAATGMPAPTYQWTLNATPISGATDPVLLVSNTNSGSAGSYACVAANTNGSTTSTAAALTVTTTSNPGRLINLSARAAVGTGNNILIGGFGVGGTGTKQLLVRGVGPALSAFFSTDLVTPQLVMLDNGGAVVATNIGWGNAPVAGSSTASEAPTTATTNLMNTLGAYTIAPGSGDTAMVLTMPAGNNTAQISGVGSTTGVALCEIYDADLTTPTARLINISARADVGTGNNILIGGFAISGATAETVLIRAVGPGLNDLLPGVFPLSAVLNQPVLTILDHTGAVIYSNTVWGGDATIAATFGTTGAFSLNPAHADSVVLVTLPPGNYTAQVSGLNSGIGIALCEIYEVR